MVKKHTKHHKKHKSKKKKQPVLLWVGIFAIIAIAAIAAMYRGGSETPEIEISESPISGSLEKVKVDFYVMSQCPYGLQVEDAIAPVLAKMGDNVDFNLEFIATDNGDGTFKALHGQPEVDGNIVQLCAIKYEPDKYMDMIVCQNKDARSIPGNWESCAAGMDTAGIKSCFEGEEGKELLRTSLKKAEAAQARGSPTIFIGDEPYRGGRSETDFMRAICNALTSKPGECSNLPACTVDADCTGQVGKVGSCDTTGEAKCVYTDPLEVSLIAISDSRCATCDGLVSQVTGQLKTIMLGLDITSYDYSDAEGKKLVDDLGIKALPALLFDGTVKDVQAYANVERYLEPAGEYLSLRVGAQFDPNAEICDNEQDDTGNGMIDCDDPTCQNTMTCRDEIENHLQAFIMSDCPYGREAVKALKEVKDNFGDALDFEIHYIANEAGDGFQSLHGQYEVDENIIQLCALEHSPDEWFDYVYCRSSKGVNGKDWKECAGETGVDVDAVQTCFDGTEGADLFREDIKIGNELGVSASPTWLANNRYKFSGIAADQVKTQFCQYNSGMAGCENTLTGQAAAPSGACG